MDQNGLPLFSSWSWAAWTGTPRFWLTEETCDYIDDGDFPSLEPITLFCVPEIYKIVLENGRRHRQRVKDLSYWRTQRPDIETQSTRLPAGKAFRHYVPLMEWPHELRINPQTLILPVVEFRTGRLFVNFIPRCLEGYSVRYINEWVVELGAKSEETTPVFYIQGVDGSVIGYMDMCGENVEVSSQKTGQHDDHIEIISIGGMDTHPSLLHIDGWEYQHRHCPRGNDSCGNFKASRCSRIRDGCVLPQHWTYRFHNVLWIEWEKGVAYRKGIGKIWGKHWEEADPEEIDIVLG